MKSEEKVELAEALRILEKWQISTDRFCKILELSNVSVTDSRSIEIDTPLTSSQLEKVQLFIEINRILNRVFDNPENADDFMGFLNHNDYFDGRTPTSIIETGNIEDIRVVFIRIKALGSPF